MTGIATGCLDDVATITLSVPERRNALSSPLLAELRGALAGVTAQARAVVLTGAGGCFSAGADIAELTGTVEDLAVDDAVEAAVEAVRSCPLPVVAAIEGPCMGAAVDLALSCDIRVAAEDAVFAVPAAALGILYSPAAMARMAGRIGHQTLARLLLAGERITGEGAVAAGLTARAVPAGEALEVAFGLARHAAGNSPEAGAATKAVLNALGTSGFDPVEWQETRRVLLASEARAERINAAKERMRKRS